MATQTATILQQQYQVTTQGGYDYASQGSTYYYYRTAGTTQWYPYTQQSQGTTPSSSSAGPIPALYSNRLASNAHDGQIGSTRIRWSPGAQGRIAQHAAERGISADSMKALTEHFVYQQAALFSSQYALVRGALHDSTTDTATGTTSVDLDHVGAELKQCPTGTKRIHIYFQKSRHDLLDYNNLTVLGVSVFSRQGSSFVLDPSLSSGTYPMPPGSGSQTTTATTTATGYGTTGQGGYTTATAGIQPQRQYDAQRQMWYIYQNGQYLYWDGQTYRALPH